MPRRRRPAVAVLAVVLVAGAAASWWPSWRDVPVVAEGLQQRRLGDAAWAAAEYLHDHARTGSILIDDSVNPMLPVIGADLDRVVAPFSGPSWTRDLADPARAEWLFVDTAGAGDAVAQALAAHPDQRARFTVAFSQGTVSVLHRGGPS
jgi:hypothetical protein